MKPTLVLYHDNCPDGFTAAWAVWTALGDEAEYHGVNYGQAPPDDVDGRHVVLVDFSYPRAQLDALAARAALVDIFDHHKTAQADLVGWETEGTNRFVVFDMERSGAGIAWDSFHPTVRRPRLIDYVETADLWRFALPDSREIREYVFSTPYTFAEWDALALALDDDLPWAVKTGATLLRAKRVRVASMCKHVRWGMLGEHRVPYVNASWDFSEVGEYLATEHSAPFGAYYFDRADKRQWGMRSRDGTDVSAVAKEFGGGGHAAAAGFTTQIGWLPP